MSTCVRCGRDLPVLTFGNASDICRICRRADQSTPTAAEDLFYPSSLRRSTKSTSAVIAINALVFLGMTIATRGKALIDPTSKILVQWGGDYGPMTLGGEPWRAFTSIWVHAGIIHLFLNMWCLDAYGRLAETLFGWRFYMALYTIAGLCGSVASLAWNPATVGVGASGAIFGVVGALVIPYKSGKLAMPLNAVKGANRRLIAFIGINLFIGTVVQGIGNAAHVGGLIGGVALGAMWTRFVSENRRRVVLATAMALLVVVSAFVAVRYVRGGVTLAHQAASSLGEGRIEEAIAKASAAVAYEDRDSYAHTILGSAYLQKEQEEKAAEEFEKAIRIDSNYEYALAHLGQAYGTLGRYPEAVKALERAVKLDPDDTTAWTHLGLAYANSDRTEDGVRAIQTALRRDPNLAYAHAALGTVRQRRNELDLAIESLRKAVGLEPEAESYAMLLADALDARGLSEEAESVRHKAGQVRQSK